MFVSKNRPFPPLPQHLMYICFFGNIPGKVVQPTEVQEYLAATTPPNAPVGGCEVYLAVKHPTPNYSNLFPDLEHFRDGRIQICFNETYIHSKCKCCSNNA